MEYKFSDRHVEKESLAEYINKKREMFLVQVSKTVCVCGVPVVSKTVCVCGVPVVSKTV